MKPNIFMIDPALGPEDALTAYWHYLLSVVPGLGQSFVDAVCRASGLAVSEFLGAIDHPYGDSDNRPDLLIQCREWSLLFEHKYLSPVGPGQLHRYVELAQSRGWKLALTPDGT
ncbi:MAG: PD-(D/E)XK nuclease family protein [Acidobacteria bacterium]|nr:PD-(D/E)XK nuclease family protein [Acidobacteriota bacterium]